MTIEVPDAIEQRLRDLASKQGRDLELVVEEALREYLDAAAITDVGASEIVQTQSELVRDLPLDPPWKLERD